jgi:phosphoglycolate phosphatase-like HAD superfamily hydrolase
LSARPQAQLDKFIQLSGMKDMFEDAIGTAGSAIAPKPAPDGIHHILRKMGVAPADAMMVGDHENDILAGKAAGTKTVALTDGMGDEAHLRRARPDFALSSMDLTGQVFDGGARAAQ